jgi:hypothetical protein
MKYLKLCSMLIGFFLLTTAFSAENSCQMNGYSIQTIQTIEANIVKAIKTQDTKRLASMVQYPLTIYLRAGKVSIMSAKIFIKLEPKMIVKRDADRLIKQLTQHPRNYICRSDGIGLINGGIWLSPNNYKIISINNAAIPNTTLTPDVPYGHSIAAITNKQTLEQFAKLYNKLHDAKVIDGPALYINQISNNYWVLNSDTNQGTINLYKTDINNTGVPKYILSYDGQGSMGTDGVQFIGTIKKDKLIPLSLNKALRRNFHIGREEWYLFHGTPFLTAKDKVYMNYTNRGVTCTYLWKGNNISLVSQDSHNCIHK